MRYTTRERYTPKGATKVTDKFSDAVAYLYSGGEAARHGGAAIPCARVFYGKQTKPVAAYQYKNEADRATSVAAYFKARQDWEARKVAAREADKAKGRGIEVGTLVYTSWGYDQTNIDYYEVTALIGQKMAEVRKVAGTDAGNGAEPWMTGKSIPKAGAYIGEPIRVLVRGGAFKVDGHFANTWDGRPQNWTSYA